MQALTIKFIDLVSPSASTRLLSVCSTWRFTVVGFSVSIIRVSTETVRSSLGGSVMETLTATEVTESIY